MVFTPSTNPYFRSHRAGAACARELESLADFLEVELDAWQASGLDHKAESRRSPGRCLVQVGPVALSLAWLRPSHEDLASGELLVVVWLGVPGVRPEYQFERVARVPVPRQAKELSEEIFRPGVVGADSWRWLDAEAGDDPARGHTAQALAARSVARLRQAYRSVPGPETAPTDVTPPIQ